MDIEEFTPEQIERAKTCKTPEELLALAKQEGVELTDAQLEQISGGDTWDAVQRLKESRCPNCSGNEVILTELDGKNAYKCGICGYVLRVG